MGVKSPSEETFTKRIRSRKRVRLSRSKKAERSEWKVEESCGLEAKQLSIREMYQRIVSENEGTERVSPASWILIADDSCERTDGGGRQKVRT
jgi:hypothetical protein